jgi:acyl-CoA synthetase (AMP-forming)/AMP-acid ligase II
MMGRFDPAQYMELIQREKITWGYAMDTMAHRFAMHPDLEKADFSTLRSFSGTRDRDAMERLQAQPTFHAGFHSGYGSSEAGGRISFKKHEDFDKALKEP